jgi:CRP-like cAMP-binding protein
MRQGLRQGGPARSPVLVLPIPSSATQELSMPVTAPDRATNLLIGILSRRNRELLVGLCDLVELEYGETICEPGRPYRHVYFPLLGFLSLFKDTAGHPPLEMGLIGNEGMLGATLLLGIDKPPLRGVVQGAGSALQMPTATFQRVFREQAPVAAMLKRYLYVLMRQLFQTTACTCFHSVEERLARWLLMTHDRAHADHFHLTHQWLADMLGVRRSAITIAAGRLQQRGLIRYTRGEITVMSRAGLEAAACECYRKLVDEYAEAFRPAE